MAHRFMIVIFTRTAKHNVRWLGAFSRGLQRHGIPHEIRSLDDGYVDCDIAVLWGVHGEQVIGEHVLRERNYIVMECAYFRDRLAYASVGWNGLNGHADFVNENSDGQRWKAHGVDIKPWRKEGEYILLCGQVQGDAATKGVDLSMWYQLSIDAIKKHTNKPIIFRPHPKGGSARPEGCFVDTRSIITESLEHAHCCVTLNSNAGVDAIINGVPVITLNNGSMAWEVSAHKYEAVNNPHMPNRQQWLNNLAYCQWLESEVANGDTWEHITYGGKYVHNISNRAASIGSRAS